MAHRGRLYPFLNRSRVISATSEWPYFAGTEYAFQTAVWSGAASLVAPTYVRELFPNAWTQGEYQIDYEGVICEFVGQPITVKLSIWLDGSHSQNWLSLSVDWNGGNCYKWDPQKSANGFPCSWNYAEPLTVTTGPNASILLGGADQIFPLLWSDSPQPPGSTPF